MRLGSGEVVIDRYRSHLHPEVVAILSEALMRVQGGEVFIVAEIEFGRPVGESICVPTQDGDEIVFAKRPRRFGYTRFVKNRRPESCDSVVVILKRDDHEDYYVLVTAFIGRRAEPEPWDRNATANSRAFWNSHALVWGGESTIPGTETTECPW